MCVSELIKYVIVLLINFTLSIFKHSFPRSNFLDLIMENKSLYILRFIFNYHHQNSEKVQTKPPVFLHSIWSSQNLILLENDSFFNIN